MKRITAARVRQLFDYDPRTGNLSWKLARGNRKAGALAQATTGQWGHIQVMIDRRNYKAHRIIWLWVTGAWPRNEIDHKDGNGGNNKWVNLREATSAQNKWNRKLNRNSTGFTGAFLDKRDGVFYSHISANGKLIYLGRFSSAEAAHDAWKRAVSTIHGEFSCLIR